MAKNDPLDFLNPDEENAIPVGGMVSQGFIAPWTVQTVHAFLIERDPTDELAAEEITPDSTQQMGESGWYRCQFRDQETATAATKMLGINNPNQYFTLRTKTRSIINANDLDKLEGGDGKKGFGPFITMEAQMSTLLSNAARHQTHMVLLPSLVYAVARGKGYDVPELDFSEILDTRNFVASDEIQARLIGASDAKPNDEHHYTNSEYWKQRVALWAALGEDNPNAYLPIGSEQKGKPSKFATTSEKLSECLRFYQHRWTTKKGEFIPVWMRVAQVIDPHMKAKGRRLPVVLEIFGAGELGERAARSAAEKDKSGEDSTPGTTSTSTTATNGMTKPAYPDAWKNVPDEWESSIGTALSEGMTDKQIVTELDAPLALVKTWKKYLGF